jgi:hypothetical protein
VVQTLNHPGVTTSANAHAKRWISAPEGRGHIVCDGLSDHDTDDEAA